MSRNSPISLAFASLAALAFSHGCDDGTEGAQAGIECAQSDLIAQCPPGSDPQLSASAKTSCEAAGDLDLIKENGSVSGKCYGEGECVVLCQFQVPCRCGVESVTGEGIICVEPCGETETACGNDVCEGGESVDSCPRDCAAECEAGRERCFGDDRQVCDLNGRWDLLPCGEGRRCEEREGASQCVDR